MSSIRASRMDIPVSLVESRTVPLFQSERGRIIGFFESLFSPFYMRPESADYFTTAIARLKTSLDSPKAKEAYADALMHRARLIKTDVRIDVLSSHILKKALGEQYSPEVEKSVFQAVEKVATKMAIETCEGILALPDGAQSRKEVNKFLWLANSAVAVQPIAKNQTKFLHVFLSNVYKTSVENLSSRSQNVTNIDFQELLEQSIEGLAASKRSWQKTGLKLLSTAALVSSVYAAYSYYTVGKLPEPIDEYAVAARATVDGWVAKGNETLAPYYGQVIDLINPWVNFNGTQPDPAPEESQPTGESVQDL